jgi:hypothetical protein
MTSEVIIDVQPKDISIALLEDKQLVEYQQEQRTVSFSVGNIYVAKVRKLMPGLNACFVDVGAERVAFLHYLDLGNQFNSYEKYLKQVVSDRKKLFPIQKAHIQPELKKDGSIANDAQPLTKDSDGTLSDANGPIEFVPAVMVVGTNPDANSSMDAASNFTSSES